MGRILRENGLSIVLFGLFAVFLIGETIAGQSTYNQMRKQHGRPPVGYLAYLVSGHNIEAIFENWESEFLQMGSSVLLTVFLFQKGSALSKKPDESSGGPEPRGPAGSDEMETGLRGGWMQTLHENSLLLAFFTLFALSFALHAIGGRIDYNDEQAQHGGTPVSLLGFLGTSVFWFQSFQNYQSEFLALGSIVVLSIFLRQKGSPQSKPVEASMIATGPG